MISEIVSLLCQGFIASLASFLAHTTHAVLSERLRHWFQVATALRKYIQQTGRFIFRFHIFGVVLKIIIVTDMELLVLINRSQSVNEYNPYNPASAANVTT